jgi:cytochrome c-type biogenesis protein CcmH/NrfG
MSENGSKSPATDWTSVQAYTLAVICLLLGIAGGWLIRGSQTPPIAAGSGALSTGAPTPMDTGAGARPSPEQLKKMADTQAAPLLEKLRSNPNDAALLANVGNIYYDAQLYPAAIGYYQQSLKLQPADASVRTDMGTAYWYTGDTDTALAELDKALQYEPNKANALFNLGIVKWQGKMDVEGAVAAWQKLLQTNPNYEGKEKVEQLIAQVKKHADIKPGTRAKPLKE